MVRPQPRPCGSPMVAGIAAQGKPAGRQTGPHSHCECTFATPVWCTFRPWKTRSPPPGAASSAPLPTTSIRWSPSASTASRPRCCTRSTSRSPRTSWSRSASSTTTAPNATGMLARVCGELGALPVQHLGKMLILWRAQAGRREADPSGRRQRPSPGTDETRQGEGQARGREAFRQAGREEGPGRPRGHPQGTLRSRSRRAGAPAHSGAPPARARSAADPRPGPGAPPPARRRSARPQAPVAKRTTGRPGDEAARPPAPGQAHDRRPGGYARRHRDGGQAHGRRPRHAAHWHRCRRGTARRRPATPRPDLSATQGARPAPAPR